ncbi:MAG: hypothetical protein KDA60_09510 [Planctomycetales bacterium]|nr:hypothetical protein [Planctomycetales bacterium]
MPLAFSPKITAFPVIHGSGDFAVEVRRLMLDHNFDCVAVPLPASFQQDVEAAIPQLPVAKVVLQQSRTYETQTWTPESDDEDDDDEETIDGTASYVPIDPCQPVIAALRVALGERIPRAFIDLETAQFESTGQVLPDPYALKQVPVEKFAAALLPAIPRPDQDQRKLRILHMAKRLRQLEGQYDNILFVCNVTDWPWIREAYQNKPLLELTDIQAEDVEATQCFGVEPATLTFMFGELPFITGLYEQARRQLDDDENLSIDGVKELLIAARGTYREDFRGRARKITPHGLSTCLKYVRNLTLLDRRLTPDLYTIVIGAKQVLGDGYALHVIEQAGEYRFIDVADQDTVEFSVDRLRLPNGTVLRVTSRLDGPPRLWRSCQLQPRPDTSQQRDWQMRWNPFSQCSWPPEDEKIENFRAHVTDKAQAIMGADLARTEKFTTSLKDGLDIRDTLRNWYTGDLYVKVQPPSRGRLDAVVMLFDSPADPREYPWRTTWFAEHQNESTLAFFATNFAADMVGPGIGLAAYGGAMFLFPPVSIADIWTDPGLDFTETLEERLLAAACAHSQCPHVALLSTLPPGPGWRSLARRFKKKWVHVPFGSFGDSTVQQLRMVHVLNGHQVRSYAANFIRKA